MAEALVVTDVNWSGIPLEVWGLVLQEIPVGRCVTRLPMNTWGHKRFRIAIPEKSPVYVGLGDAVSSAQIPVVEYEQVSLFDKTIVWKRVS